MRPWDEGSIDMPTSKVGTNRLDEITLQTDLLETQALGPFSEDNRIEVTGGYF